MFPRYTLYPGGAFMLCESIDEVDVNIPTPQPPMNTAVKQAAVAMDDDPVLKVVNKLGEVYRKDVTPLMNMSYEYEDVSTAVAALEQVSQSASHMVECLQKRISKLVANLAALNLTLYEDPVFNSHLGLFMKKYDAIHRQGLGSYEYSYSAMEAFRSSWNVDGIIAVLENQPDLMNDIVFMSDMRAFMGGDSSEPILQVFESFPDLIECIYNQSERMARLEAVQNRTLNISHLMARNRRSELDASPCDSTGDEITQFMKRFFRIMSVTLRSIMKECYSTECDLLDGTIPVADAGCAVQFRKILAKCVNLFAIGTMISMYMATQARGVIAEKRAIGEYAKLLVDTLKSA